MELALKSSLSSFTMHARLIRL